MFKWLVRYAERQWQAPDAHPAAPDAEPPQSSADGLAADGVPQEAQQPAGATSSWPLPAEQPPAVGCTLRSQIHTTPLHQRMCSTLSQLPYPVCSGQERVCRWTRCG